MAGGKGERFWPRSREKTPKQLQRVYSDKTLLEETLLRARSITDAASIYIGCNETLKKIIRKTHKSIPEKNFIVEPEARNTAPIVALAALTLEQKFPGRVHVVLSADHFITPIAEFQKTMEKAVATARAGYLVTLGVKPSRPETGYGYIQAGKAISPGVRKIGRFVEKPDAARAAEFIQRTDHLWNSGIFIWKGETIIGEFETHARDIIDPILAGMKSRKVLEKKFKTVPKTPIDIAIMEKSSRVAVVDASFTWDDVGSWLSLERIVPDDGAANVFVPERSGKTRVVLNARGNTIVSDRKLIAVLGVNDVIVVDEGDVLFISSRDGIAGIKDLTASMRENPSLQKYLI